MTSSPRVTAKHCDLNTPLQAILLLINQLVALHLSNGFRESIQIIEAARIVLLLVVLGETRVLYVSASD